MENETYKDKKRERAVLAFVFLQENEEEKARRRHELKEIVRSCGGDVIAVLEQNVERYNPRTLIGKGKVEEIARFVEEQDIAMVVFEQELTGSQRSHLSDAIPCKILDRVDLILDIFALRARTVKAKLDVELAQLAYRLPNLRGYGQVMSRTGGGIGTRGPGEQKLETDRRAISERMKRLRARREAVQKQEHEAGKKRRQSALPIVSLVGYTNAGKSTILNALLERFGEKDKTVYADDRLFATLEVHMRRIAETGEPPYLLADTIGFIHDLPKKLIAPFESTLEEIRGTDLIVHVVDCSEEGVAERVKTVQDMTREAGEHIPVLFVMNKADKGSEPGVTPQEDTLWISARREADILKLQDAILTRLFGEKGEETVCVPYAQAEALYAVRQSGTVLEEKSTEQGYVLRLLRRERTATFSPDYDAVSPSDKDDGVLSGGDDFASSQQGGAP